MGAAGRVLVFTALLAATGAPRVAHAQQQDELKPIEKSHWYGWQTLIVDGAATGLMITAVATSPDADQGAIALLAPTHLLRSAPDTTAFINASVAFYTLAPAFVHAVHGRGVQAALSPPVRLFAPTLGTLTGAAYGFLGAIAVAIVTDERDTLGDDSTSGRVLIGCIASGYFLGFLAPMILDAFVFGHEPASPVTSAAPQVRLGPGGLHGTF